MNGEIPFGLPERKKFLDDYTGEYAIIDQRNSKDSAGKIVEIKEGYVLLLPYQSSVWNGDRTLEKRFIEHGKPQTIPLSEVITITPTTRNNIENYQRYQARKFMRDEIKEELEFSKNVRVEKESVYIDGAGI